MIANDGSLEVSRVLVEKGVKLTKGVSLFEVEFLLLESTVLNRNTGKHSYSLDCAAECPF